MGVIMLWEQWACCCVVIRKSTVTLDSVNLESPNRTWGHQWAQMSACPSGSQHTIVQSSSCWALRASRSSPGVPGMTWEPPSSSLGTDIHTWNDQTNSSPLCLSQQGSQELSWPGIGITGREQKDKWLTDACPAIPPGPWLKGQPTAICRIYIFLHDKNAEYSVFQILGVCPSGLSL